MQIRSTIHRSGKELFCHKSLAEAHVTRTFTVRQAIQGLELNAQRAFMNWLTKGGPFWNEQRTHGEDEWFEVEDGTLVTDSAIAEAAYCISNQLSRETVSFSPSDFLRNPITVCWRSSQQLETRYGVSNHWSTESVATRLADLPIEFDSWTSLSERLVSFCDQINFGNDFMQMDGFPYVKSIAEGIWQLVTVLNRLSGGIDSQGNRAQEFESLHETFFKGQDPYFTDESVPNLRNSQFVNRMTFPHPAKPGQFVMCSWHGKVNAPKNFVPVRIHFSWPLTTKGELYLPYIGKKLTM